MIELLNIKPGDVFQQAIVLIHGVCVVYSCPLVQVLDSSGQSIEWSIKNGHFKVKIYLILCLDSILNITRPLLDWLKARMKSQ